MLLNSDTVLFTDTIASLLEVARNHSKNVGIIGPRLLNKDRSLQPSGGNFPTISATFFGNLYFDRVPLLRKISPTFKLLDPIYYNKERTFDWLTGACLFIRKSVVDATALFDENYFMYVEEVDLCYRARQFGFSVLYSPKASLVHLFQGSSKSKTNAIRNTSASLVRYSQKFYGSFYRKSFLTVLLLNASWQYLRCVILTVLRVDTQGRREGYQQSIKVVLEGFKKHAI